MDRPVMRCSSTRAAARWRPPRPGPGRRARRPARAPPDRATAASAGPAGPPGLLEVGFEQEGQIAEAVVATPGDLVDGRQPPSGPGLPLVQGTRQDRLGQVGVARDAAGVEQAQGHLDVGVHGAAHLLGGPHAVIQVQPGVPDRVPDGVGDRLDAAPPVVHEQQVQVAARRDLAPAVAADGQQRHPLVVAAGGAGEHPRRASRRQPRRRPAPGDPGQGPVVEQRRPGRPQWRPTASPGRRHGQRSRGSLGAGVGQRGPGRAGGCRGRRRRSALLAVTGCSLAAVSTGATPGPNSDL